MTADLGGPLAWRRAGDLLLAAITSSGVQCDITAQRKWLPLTPRTLLAKTGKENSSEEAARPEVGGEE